MLDAYIQERIGLVLRARSEDVLNEPIPEKLLAVLAVLEAKELEGQ